MLLFARGDPCLPACLLTANQTIPKLVSHGLRRSCTCSQACKDCVVGDELRTSCLLQGLEDMQMLALLHQAQVQHAARGALKDLDIRADLLEAEIEKQQDIGLQVGTRL